MRKPLMAVALLTVALFGVGYIVGQVRGPTVSAAAATTATPSPAAAQAGSQAWGASRQLGTHADGTVTAVNGDTVTVKADADAGNPDEYKGVTTIKLTRSTTYGGPWSSSSTTGKSSITAGSYILAWGTVSSDGKTLTATNLAVMPSGGPGNQTAPNGNSSTFFGPPASGYSGPSA